MADQEMHIYIMVAKKAESLCLKNGLTLNTLVSVKGLGQAVRAFYLHIRDSALTVDLVFGDFVSLRSVSPCR
jgi:hypothetical protein